MHNGEQRFSLTVVFCCGGESAVNSNAGWAAPRLSHRAQVPLRSKPVHAAGPDRAGGWAQSVWVCGWGSGKLCRSVRAVPQVSGRRRQDRGDVRLPARLIRLVGLARCSRRGILARQQRQGALGDVERASGGFSRQLSGCRIQPAGWACRPCGTTDNFPSRRPRQMAWLRTTSERRAVQLDGASSLHERKKLYLARCYDARWSERHLEVVLAPWSTNRDLQLRSF